jgi:hypothetical protein
MNQQIIQGMARHLLTALGGALVAKGYTDSDGLNEIIGAVITLAGAIWSIVHKMQDQKTQGTAGTAGKVLGLMGIMGVMGLMVGCAHVKTTTTCIEMDGTSRTTEVTAWAVLDSKNELAKVKTTNTDRTQSVGWDGMEQSASGTNVVAITERVSAAVVSAAIKAASGK